MDFEEPGPLPGPASVSLIVPDSLTGEALSLFALDTAAGTYRLQAGGLRAVDGYVSFTLTGLGPLVLSAGMPQALPAAFRAPAGALQPGAGTEAGPAPAAAPLPAAIAPIVPQALADGLLCALAAGAAVTACALAARQRSHRAYNRSRQLAWAGGGAAPYALEDLPGIDDLMAEAKISAA
jgi:hypothetical protein